MRTKATTCLLTAVLSLGCEDALLVEPAAPAMIGVSLSLASAAKGFSAAAYDKADSVHVAVFKAANFNEEILDNFDGDFTPEGALHTTSARFQPQAETRVQVEFDLDQDVDTLVVIAALSRGRAPLFVGGTPVVALRGEVSAAPIELIAVPSDLVVAPIPNMTALGATAQVNAAVVFATGDTVPDFSLSYESSNVEVATVDGNGLVTARGEGQAQITVNAFDSGENFSFNESITVTVQAAIASITVAPSPASVLMGNTIQFTATARDSRQNVLSRTFTWASSATGVASINASTGVATGVAVGTATITASSGGVTSQGVTLNVLQRTFTLTVNAAGVGSGVITGGGINCTIIRGVILEGTCSVAVLNGTTVTLVASPATGAIFGGMAGATCTGTICTVSMTQNRTVTARFDLGTAPTISGLVNFRVVFNAPGCSATHPFLLEFSFSFADPNGDIGVNPIVNVSYVFRSSGNNGLLTFTGSRSGTGTNGTVTFGPGVCWAFNNDTTVEVTATLTDASGLISNPNTVTVPRPVIITSVAGKAEISAAFTIPERRTIKTPAGGSGSALISRPAAQPGKRPGIPPND